MRIKSFKRDFGEFVQVRSTFIRCLFTAAWVRTGNAHLLYLRACVRIGFTASCDAGRKLHVSDYAIRIAHHKQRVEWV